MAFIHSPAQFLVVVVLVVILFGRGSAAHVNPLQSMPKAFRARPAPDFFFVASLVIFGASLTWLLFVTLIHPRH